MPNPNHLAKSDTAETRGAVIGQAMVAADRLVGLLGRIDKSDGTVISPEQFTELQTRLASLTMRVTALQLRLSPDIARSTAVTETAPASSEESASQQKPAVLLSRDFIRSDEIRY